MFFVVQRLLKQTRETSEVIYVHDFPVGTMDFKRLAKENVKVSLPRERPTDWGIRIDFEEADDFLFKFDWTIMAGSVRRTQSTPPGEARIVPVFGLNPNGFQGPHWRGWLHQSRLLGIPMCESYSPILTELRDTYTLPGLDAIRTRPVDEELRSRTIIFLRRPHSNREISNGEQVKEALSKVLDKKYIVVS